MKTLYIDIDEDITDVISKVKALKGSQLLLVIPKDAEIFNNAVNLQVLKKTAEDEERELQVFTNDEKGQKMLRKVGVKLYQGHLHKRKKSTSGQLSKLPSSGVAKLDQKRVSITDISEKARKKKTPVMSSPQKKQTRREQREWTSFFLLNTLKKKTVIAFTSFAVIFFFLVVYVAVPSSTIYLTPASNILETTVNILLANPDEQPELFRNPSSHAIVAKPIEIEFEKTIIFPTTGKVFTGANARCNLKVVNNRTSPWTLVARTRFIDATGVIFRIRDDVEVPAARFDVVRDEEGNASREKVPGTLVVSAESDEKDENGNIIGARGNLPANTIFTLPGLSEFNQTLLTASNEMPCRGGVTEFYNVATEEDLEASQEKIVAEMESSARQYLIDFVDGENVKRVEQKDEMAYISPVVLFDDARAITYEVIETTLPPDLKAEDRTDEFSVAGKMKVKGLAYEQQSYYELLEQGLLSKVHPDKVLEDVDNDSVTYQIVYSDSDLEDLSMVKISVTVRGLEEYNFDPRSDQGQEIIEQIMNYIPGKTKSETSYFISNLEEIQKAHISIWPFWKNTLPERTSAITIKVQ